jgi:hypothetical protein
VRLSPWKLVKIDGERVRVRADVKVSAASSSLHSSPRRLICSTTAHCGDDGTWLSCVGVIVERLCTFGKQVMHRCPGPVITAHLL